MQTYYSQRNDGNNAMRTTTTLEKLDNRSNGMGADSCQRLLLERQHHQHQRHPTRVSQQQLERTDRNRHSQRPKIDPHIQKRTYGSYPDHINVMTDILAIMHENKDTTRWNNEPEVHRLLVKEQEIHSVPYMASWIRSFKIIGLMTAISGVIWVILTYCGGAAYIGYIVPYLIKGSCLDRKNTREYQASPATEPNEDEDETENEFEMQIIL